MSSNPFILHSNLSLSIFAILSLSEICTSTLCLSIYLYFCPIMKQSHTKEKQKIMIRERKRKTNDSAKNPKRNTKPRAGETTCTYLLIYALVLYYTIYTLLSRGLSFRIRCKFITSLNFPGVFPVRLLLILMLLYYCFSRKNQISERPLCPITSHCCKHFFKKISYFKDNDDSVNHYNETIG